MKRIGLTRILVVYNMFLGSPAFGSVTWTICAHAREV